MTGQALPQAILLDLDDTIIDDSRGVDYGWTVVVGEDATSIPGLDPQRLRAAIFEVRDWFWSDAERASEGRLDLRATSNWIVAEALSRVGIDSPDTASAIANRY